MRPVVVQRHKCVTVNAKSGGRGFDSGFEAQHGVTLERIEWWTIRGPLEALRVDWRNLMPRFTFLPE